MCPPVFGKKTASTTEWQCMQFMQTLPTMLQTYGCPDTKAAAETEAWAWWQVSEDRSDMQARCYSTVNTGCFGERTQVTLITEVGCKVMVTLSLCSAK